MKKFFLLFACALALGACNTKPTPNDDPYGYRQTGRLLYASTMSQLIYNLEPFSMAFRFNTLMVECENAGFPLTDLNNAPLKSKLLGASTTIENSGEGAYKVIFAGKIGEDDYLRTGAIRLNTNGKPLKDGNSWIIILPKENPYTVSVSGTPATITAESYMIGSQQDNSWKIWLTHFVATIPSSSDIANEKGSDWTGSFVITQVNNPGDQSIQGISTSSFTVEIPEATKVTTVYYDDELDVSVDADTPLTYTPACGANITSGEIVISFSERIDLLNFATCKWTPADGEGAEACKPVIDLRYHGMSIPITQ